MLAKPKKTTKKQEAEKEAVKEVPKGPQYYEAVGRRREASARVRLYVVGESPVTVSGVVLDKGSFFVNGKTAEVYFPGEVWKKMYLEPFRTTNTVGRFGVSVKAAGGGLSGQLIASIHGMSRALEKVDREKFRPILKKRGFLTRDPRAKERRKAGLAGKARAKKQSPKR
jgi:small subunit ribosomal protein S9